MKAKSLFLLWIGAFIIQPVSASESIENGQLIYQQGISLNGTPITAMRDGIELTASQAACVQCHRPSGMGSVEGDILVPPITGNYLFNSGDLLLATMDPRSGKRFNQAHSPYDSRSLERAIRQGINVSGKEMSVLMPRYHLSDSDMHDVVAYLTQLSKYKSPGVTKDKIHLATVITPDVSTEKKEIFIKEVKRILNQKNGSTVVGKNSVNRRHMVTAAEFVLGTERKWELDIWELKGPPSTWNDQLEAYYNKQPVFSLVSGLSTGEWQPVHDFCEKHRLPDWFPSVDQAIENPDNFYNLYYQKGLTLEAKVLASSLKSGATGPVKHLIQYYRQGTVGEKASKTLEQELVGRSIKVDSRAFSMMTSNQLPEELGQLNDETALILWLNPSDVALFKDLKVPRGLVYLSGRLMADGAFPLPKSWVGITKMIYPYELPENRLTNLDFFHRWAKFGNMPIVDEPLQSEVYFSFEYFSETVGEMLENFHQDYLIERAEYMLSRSEKGKSEQRDRVRQVLRWSTRMPRGTVQEQVAQQEDIEIEKKVLENSMASGREGRGTSIYPRLGLGVAQRFGSKGAYIVRFDPTSDLVSHPRLVAESDWIIP